MKVYDLFFQGCYIASVRDYSKKIAAKRFYDLTGLEVKAKKTTRF